MRLRLGLTLLVVALSVASCSGNSSNGERIGVITQFSRSGVIWKSWEGHLNTTQTGMNSSVPFDFSIDNDNEPPQVIHTLDSAAEYGWKVKLIYYEKFGANWLNNRGETSHFITTVDVLDRHPMSLFGQNNSAQGKIVDTIYVVIVPKSISK